MIVSGVHCLVEAQPLHIRITNSRGTSRHLFGIEEGRELDEFAFDVGSHFLIRSASGKPTHGITIDQASTQR